MKTQVMDQPRDAGAAIRTAWSPAALQAFGNRVHKTFQHRARWARRRDLGAFRFYDRDLPEFPVSLDAYVPADATLGLRVHLQEFDTGWMQTGAEHAAWLAAVRGAIGAVIPVQPRHIVFTVRPRRRANAQHTKTGRTGEEFQIIEQGLRFWINLGAYLDTGLFLDHRAIRAMVRSRAAGRRVLNLFGYTGSFSVYAAAGGAERVVTVDLSHTYLAWAERNLVANGIDPARHPLVRADVLRWLPQVLDAGERYDLIVLDPPAFSNSKAMHAVLDVQRDHGMLIESCLALLAPGGELFFSTNLRSFRLDSRFTSVAEDLARETHAEDFRDARVHHAYRFRSRA